MSFTTNALQILIWSHMMTRLNQTIIFINSNLVAFKHMGHEI
tara:strand:- start:2152 stop:2277 length:126 start_codon:yes stop_codon:yes gene_type:complete